jgi:hypothetical protein
MVSADGALLSCCDGANTWSPSYRARSRVADSRRIAMQALVGCQGRVQPGRAAGALGRPRRTSRPLGAPGNPSRGALRVLAASSRHQVTSRCRLRSHAPLSCFQSLSGRNSLSPCRLVQGDDEPSGPRLVPQAGSRWAARLATGVRPEPLPPCTRAPALLADRKAAAAVAAGRS